MKRIVLVLLCVPFLLAGGPNEPPELIDDDKTRRVVSSAFETMRGMMDSTDTAYELADSTRQLLDWHLGDYARFDFGDIRVVCDTHTCSVGQAFDNFEYPDSFATGIVFPQITIANMPVIYATRIDSLLVDIANSTNRYARIRHTADANKRTKVIITAIGGKP